MTSWRRFVFQAAPWHWRLLLAATYPLWAPAAQRTWVLAGPDEEALQKLREFVLDLGAGKLNRWIGFGATYARLDLDASDRLLNAELLDFEGPEGM